MALKNLTEKARDLVPLNWGKRPVRVHDESHQSLPASPPDIPRMFGGILEDFFSRGFGEHWAAPFGEPLAGFGAGWPRVDLEETDRAFKVTAEVPGLDAKDIDVTIGDRSLIIRGSKTGDREEHNKDYHLMETYSGSFYRTIPLAMEVDRDRVEAHCKNGQLLITLPKMAAGLSVGKRIEVK